MSQTDVIRQDQKELYTSSLAHPATAKLLMKPKHWDAVERVAASLLEKKILSGVEIDKICNCQ